MCERLTAMAEKSQFDQETKCQPDAQFCCLTAEPASNVGIDVSMQIDTDVNGLPMLYVSSLRIDGIRGTL